MNHNEKLRKYLVEELQKRKEKNSFYSMNSFARSLGLSSGALSQILAGKRNIGSRTAVKIAQNLTNSTPDQRIEKIPNNPFEESTIMFN